MMGLSPAFMGWIVYDTVCIDSTHMDIGIFVVLGSKVHTLIAIAHLGVLMYYDNLTTFKHALREQLFEELKEPQ